jgi:hypothetical protein
MHKIEIYLASVSTGVTQAAAVSKDLPIIENHLSVPKNQET